MAANDPGQPPLTTPVTLVGIVSIDLPSPSVALAIVALMLVTYIPGLSLWLARLV